MSDKLASRFDAAKKAASDKSRLQWLKLLAKGVRNGTITESAAFAVLG